MSLASDVDSTWLTSTEIWETLALFNTIQCIILYLLYTLAQQYIFAKLAVNKGILTWITIWLHKIFPERIATWVSKWIEKFSIMSGKYLTVFLLITWIMIFFFMGFLIYYFNWFILNFEPICETIVVEKYKVLFEGLESR